LKIAVCKEHIANTLCARYYWFLSCMEEYT
jgi:hypothetical protein